MHPALEADLFTAANHTYAICAYGDSPYLQDCIQSLVNQTSRSSILLATSTPSDYISSLCDRFGIQVHVNPGPGGIAGDWNFAVSQARTELVTIAHQDDVYLPTYTEEMLGALNGTKNPTLYFTDYGELRDAGRVDDSRFLNIKRALLFPLRSGFLNKFRFVRRRCLSLGDPICCPSATLLKARIEEPLFQANYGSDLDWEAWEKLANLKGSFVYNPKVLMLHRIHEESETSRLIEDGERSQEDLSMLAHFWPKPVAKAINHLYSTGQASNTLS